MSPRLQVSIVLMSLVILIGIIELVRRRRLREEYSFLWLVTGFGLFALALFPDILLFISRFVGTELPVNAIFLFGLVFVMLILLYFSLRISSLTTQVKNLAQEVTLLQVNREDK